MAFTLGNVIADARVDLNDRNAVRWTSADMTANANAALQELIGLRPDLVFGNIAAGQAVLTDAQTVPVPDRYRQALSLNVQAQCYRLNTDRGSYEKANDLYAGFIKLAKGL